MKDCHDDIVAYHNEEVTLPEKDRTDMRERRDANRKSLKAGLERDKEPKPKDNRSQGSYAMRTMVQQSDKDYDIDDGVYFLKEDIKGPRDGDRTPADAKEMVRKAVHKDSFKTAPAVRTNCVRVYYNEGYHVDLPVYRVITTTDDDGETTEEYELAGSEWKQSDPKNVTTWFKDENKSQSPDTDNGRQLRRITRDLKKFARSRDSWKSRVTTGFVISKLVTECYQSNTDREDTALHATMKSIRDRLAGNLEVDHPVLNEKLTSGADDAKTRFFKEKLTDALLDLDILFDSTCTTKQARKAWDKVFKTDFFGERPTNDDDDGSKSSAAIILSRGDDARDAVDKKGGGTYAVQP